MLDRIIRYSYYLLFLITPLFWASGNFELFEFNKMILVYFLTIVIVTAWIYKSLNQKQIIFKRTPLDLPLLAFLLAQILSTLFSIDRHTSLWGYYSRSNGGLFSTISYLLLYFGLVSNLNREQVLHLVKFGLLGGLIVALYAIPEHFGASPSCFLINIFKNGPLFTDSCWVQDVQARVFATLGQPNWLAAYLSMLIFPAIYFAITASSFKNSILYALLSILYYAAFTFTYSQGATLGLLGGFGIMIVGSLWFSRNSPIKIALLFGFLTIFLLINLFFGSALSRFNLSNYLHKSPATSQITKADTNPTPAPAGVTQLENGGTDSGKIRLIVWTGAWQIFLHYPIFGSGVETFAYSYYNYRPIAHNMVSEWDFLYNKAHNEYLNYLATTGAVGFLTYMAVIIMFIVYSLSLIVRKQRDQLMITAFLASYISYLIQNFFGFSVVIVALFFFVFPGIVFVITDSTKELSPRLKTPGWMNGRVSSLTFRIAIVLIGLGFCFEVSRIWYADTLFAKGENYSDAGLATQAYHYLSAATTIRPDEPYYKNELGFTASTIAVVAATKDATVSADLKDVAASETIQSLKISPRNVSFLRTAIRTFYQLSTLDPNFEKITFDVIDSTQALAPTDPKVLYNKALILGQLNREQEGIDALKKAIELKPNYREAYLTEGEYYAKLGKIDEAKQAYEVVLKLVPNDPEALDGLKALVGSGK